MSERLLEVAAADRCDLLIVGDTHVNSEAVVALTELAGRLGLRFVVQLGDFGFWPRHPVDNEFLATLTAAAAAHDVAWAFIDGNHDDHDALAALDVAADGTRPVTDWVSHLPRGFRFTAAGVRFGCLGGAFSIDRAVRTPGVSWFPQEVVTDDDVAALGDAPLDVLLTHDMPTGVTVHGVSRLDAARETASYLSRRCITDAVAATRPRLVVHGHWHHRYAVMHEVVANGERHTFRLEGLADDSGGNAMWAVLRCPDVVVAGVPAGPPLSD